MPDKEKELKHDKKKKSLMFFLICIVAVILIAVVILLVVGGIYLFKKETKDECIDFYANVCSKNESSTVKNENENVRYDTEEDGERAESLDQYKEAISKLSYVMEDCLNTEKLNEEGLTPLQKFLTSFPQVPESGGMDQVLDIMGKVTNRLPTNGLFNVFWAPNFFNVARTPTIVLSTVMEFLVNTPPSVTPRTNIRIDPENYDSMVSVISRILKAIGRSNNANSSDTVVEQVVRFWYGINMLKDKPQTDEMELSSISELSQASGINWLPFFEAAFKHESITPQTTIILHEKTRILRTCTILEMVCGGPRTIVNFVLISAIRPLLQVSTTEMQGFADDLNSMVVANPIKSEPRKEMCYAFAQAYVPNIMGVILHIDYVRKDNVQIKISEIIENIKNTYLSEIEKNEWLRADSKGGVKDKINGLEYELYFPQRDEDANSLIIAYKEVHVPSVGSFDNLMSFIQLRVAEALKQDHKNTTWPVNPMAKVAWNVYYENKFYITAALLKSLNFPNIEDTADVYGTLGFIIAHTIARGLDSTGIMYDKDGQFVQNSILDPESRSEFEKRMNILVAQYDHNCHNAELCVNGRKTLNDNIAYLTGLKMSYLALTRSADNARKTVGTSARAERFFRAFAQFHCVEQDQSFVQWLIRGYDVCPNSYRVNGAISNLEEFGTEFNCVFSSKMRHDHAVVIW